MAGYSSSSSSAAPSAPAADSHVPTATWMWSDAGDPILRATGVVALNPNRWSDVKTIDVTIRDLERYLEGKHGERPVTMKACNGWGSKVVQNYAGVQAAISDLRAILGIGASFSEVGNESDDPTNAIDDRRARGASISFLATQSVSTVKWMWADAGLIPVLAKMNPNRWSQEQSLEDAIASLEEYVDKRDAKRGVKMEIYGSAANASGTTATHAAPSVAEAIKTLKALLAEQRGRGDASGATNAATAFLPGLAGGAIAAVMGLRGPYTGALTAFGAKHADMTWVQAGAAALRVAAVPFDLQSEQAKAGRGAHPQVQTTWEKYTASNAKRYADAFLEDAHKVPAERPRRITARLDSEVEETWELMEVGNAINERYWCVYANDGGRRCVLVFIGGDGSTEANKEAPGSCGRRLVARDYEKPEESTPLELVEELCAREDRDIVVMGYSNGCIPLLTVMAILANKWPRQLSRFIQYNPAMLFAPEWLLKSLPEDWWLNAPHFSSKVETWAILDDPLGSGIPARPAWRLPRSPGTTRLLPPKVGFPWIANHSLCHFVE